MKGKKDENIFLNLSSNGKDWMKSFRENIGILRNYYGWSVRVLADKADVSESTLNKIIHGITKDCDQSLTIKIARAFNVSVDELIGAETIAEKTRNTIAMTRVLEDHVREVVRIYAKHQYILHRNNNSGSKEITVIEPMCIHGRLKRNSLADSKVSLEKLNKATQEIVNFGIRIPCDHYEPYFIKGEIILLGFDREGANNEPCVISSNGYIYICIKKIEVVNGKKEINYISITNKKKIFAWQDIDDRFGYVIGFLHPDGTWGVR